MPGLSRKTIVGGLGACAVWAFAVAPAGADYRDTDKDCVVELSDGLADQCKGDDPERHKDGRYLYFTTSSRIPGGGGHYYRTCIDNESDSAIRVHWVLPEQDGTIPSGCAWTENRYKDHNDTLEGSHKSCIKHGPHLTHRKADIIIHESEEHLLARENYQGDCPPPGGGSAYKSDTDGTSNKGNSFEKDGLLKKWSHAFVTSTREEFEGTFFKVSAQTSLTRTSDNGYDQFVFFSVSQVKPRNAHHAPPNDQFPVLRVRPADENINKMLEGNQEGLTFRIGDDRLPLAFLSLKHTLTKPPEFTAVKTTAYRIQGRDETGEWRRLGSVTGPLWISR